MRIFLDVGAHFGESVLRALHPRFGFEEVIAFEPSSVAQSRLRRIKDPRLRIEPYALGINHEFVYLFGAGYLGASLFRDKEKLVMPYSTERVEVKPAHEVLLPLLSPENEVWLKMNCEGAEVDIISSLWGQKMLEKFEQIYIDWDARKVPSLSARIQDSIQKLESSGCLYVNAHDFEETGWLGVERWLSSEIQPKRPLSDYERKNQEWKFLRFPWSLISYTKYQFPQLWKLATLVYLKLFR